MNATMQNFIDDITSAISEIKNSRGTDYKRIYHLYKALHERYINLDEKEFSDYRFYNDHLKNISQSVDENLTLSMLQNGHPDYAKDGFPLVLISLKFLRDEIYSIATNQ